MNQRLDVRLPSGPDHCAAWLWPPPDGGANGAKTPSDTRQGAASDRRGAIVVLGHGFGAVKEARLDAYAERFAAAGFAALAFDYRGFGESGGEPRQLVDVARQHADWHAAIAFARAQPGVDPARVVLWGTSFAGGHVVPVAVRDGRVAAVISQIPFTSGAAALTRVPPGNLARLTAAGVADQLAALAGRGPRTVPAVAEPGELAVMSAPGALEGYRAMHPEGFGFRNEVAARVALRVPTYAPARKARRLSCPWLVQVAANDATTPAAPALRAAARAPRAEVHSYPIDHFDAYRGEWFERFVADQVEFLDRHLT